MAAKLPRKAAKRRSSVDDTSDLVQRVGADRAAFLVDRVARSVDAAVGELDDARVRVALDLLLEMFRPVTIAESAVRPHPDFCPNCDTRSEPKKLFCSELCNQEAQLIRYIRRVLKDGRGADVEVLRDGIGTRMLMVRSGGYPTRARTIAPALRAAVVARDAGRCVLCGEPGTEIDHIRGSSDELTNLRLTCKTCNGDRVRDAAVIAKDPETIALIQRQNSRISQRIAAAAPYRLCDDEERWSTAWRTYKKLPPPPPPIPALCEVPGCTTPPAVHGEYANRCYTCFRALCNEHTDVVRTGPARTSRAR